MEGSFFKFSNQGFVRPNDEVLRIMMVGKTGIGKSAIGNMILGRNFFESKLSAESMTVDCCKGTATVNGQQVAVIDTPGLFDTRFGADKTTKDLSSCITFAAPGPHVFLVVVKLGRFTEEEKQTVQKIQEIFGQAADKYSMVLFTGGDSLEGTIEEFLAGSSDLQELVARCNGQYHVFNNKKNNHTQVNELFQKIRNIVMKNGGSHYTNDMFQEAERAVEEKKQQILKEKEEKIRIKPEELERKLKEKYEKEIKIINEQFKAERERERKEREEERKRDKQEIDEERKREREEREQERKREREKEERKRDKQIDEERKREKEEREQERKREKGEREKDLTSALNKLKERHMREVNEETEKLQSKYEKEARKGAEESNPIFNAVKTIGSLFK